LHYPLQINISHIEALLSNNTMISNHILYRYQIYTEKKQNRENVHNKHYQQQNVTNPQNIQKQNNKIKNSNIEFHINHISR